MLLGKALKLTGDVRVTTKPLLHQRESLDVMNDQSVLTRDEMNQLTQYFQTALFICHYCFLQGMK